MYCGLRANVLYASSVRKFVYRLSVLVHTFARNVVNQARKRVAIGQTCHLAAPERQFRCIARIIIARTRASRRSRERYIDLALIYRP